MEFFTSEEVYNESHLNEYYQLVFGIEKFKPKKGEKMVSKKVKRNSSQMIINDKETTDKLVEENEKLVYHVANNSLKKYAGILEFEEIKEACYYALFKAERTFDSKSNYKFSTYACICMNNEIRMLLRKSSLTKYNRNKICLVSIDSELEINNLKDEKISLVDTIEDTKSKKEFEEIENNISGISFDRFFEWFINTKNLQRNKKETYIKMVNLAKEKGYLKQEELSKILGLSRSYISRLRLNLYKEYVNWKKKNEN